MTEGNLVGLIGLGMFLIFLLLLVWIASRQ